MSTFIEARVIQKVDTEANWMANPLKLYQGEVAYVSDKNNFKLNTTEIPKTFAELDYYYNGDIIGGVLPTDDLASKPDGVYRAVTSGTYRGVVVKEGYYTLLRKTGSVWSLESEVKMPMQDLTAIEKKVNDNETKVDNFIEKKDINGGWVSHDKFEEMTSGAPDVIVKTYDSTAFNIVGAVDKAGTFHTEWNGSFVTDFISISAGQMVEVTGVSNNIAEVPIFVVYKSDKKTVLFKQNADYVGVNTKSYIAETDCYIRANCALKANVSSCRIKIYSRGGLVTKILSNANIRDYQNTEIGFLTWSAANSALDLKPKKINEVKLDIYNAPFIAKKRLLKTNTVIDDTLTTTKLLYNFPLNGKKYLHLKGRMYDDRSEFLGVIGIKSNGDLVEVLGVQGGVTEPFVYIDLVLDVSMYDKISMCVDTSVYPFEGSFFDGMLNEFYSQEIEDLKKVNSEGLTMKQRIINGDKPIEVKGLTSQRNEANIFQFKGETFFLWSEGWDTAVIKVGKYNVVTNTVSDITTAIDATTSGINAPIFKCPTTFIINQKIYLIMTTWKPNNCILYESLDGRNFTEVSRTLAKVAGFATYGNHWIIPEKIDGYYYWFIEGLVNNVWRMNLLKSKQIDTGWELVGEVKGLTSGNGAKGGPCVYYQNGKFKMIYHYGPGSTNLPTYIAYAESDVNDPLYFKPLYYPLMAIENKPWGSLTDQYADPELCEIDGKTYLFCSVVDNTTPRATIYRWECNGRLSDILNSRI